MRSEKEIREKIEYYRLKRDSFPLKGRGWQTHDALVSAFEWMLSEPAPEPLTAKELAQLRKLMNEWPCHTNNGINPMSGATTLSGAEWWARKNAE